MAFKIEGIIDVTVTDAYISEAHWQPKDGELNNQGLPIQAWGDVCLVVADKDGNSDIWRGELSNRDGSGNRAHQQQTDITLEKIVDIGFNVPTFQALMDQCDDNMTIPNMIGMELSITTEKRSFKRRDGKQGEAIQIKYINRRGEGGPRRISKADFMAKFAQPAAVPQPPPVQPAAVPQPPQPSAVTAAVPQGVPVPPPVYYQPQPSAAPQPPVQPSAVQQGQVAASPNCPY